MKTWQVELFIVAIILSSVNIVAGQSIINWITIAAVLFTFNHAQIGDRLQERQGKLDVKTVECYYKLNRLFAAKELLWIAAFLAMNNYAAIVGSFLFFLYPFWRKFYRSRIKPLK